MTPRRRSLGKDRRRGSGRREADRWQPGYVGQRTLGGKSGDDVDDDGDDVDDDGDDVDDDDDDSRGGCVDLRERESEA